MPVPAQDLFQSKLGYGGTGYPWTINESKGVRYDYDPAQFPVAQMLCDTYTIVHGVHAPNGDALMDKIVAAFQKVFASLGRGSCPRGRSDLPRRRWSTLRCRLREHSHEEQGSLSGRSAWTSRPGSARFRRQTDSA